jgi:hypothetical protein
MLQLPEFPDVLSSQRAQAPVYMRFEDVAQDGSLKVGGMPHAIGLVSLGKLWLHTALSDQTRPLGIVPILTRLAMETLGGPISVRKAVLADGSYQLAHTRNANREISRILLNAYVDLHAPIGRTHSPQPANAGTQAFVGRAFAEHVFTKPWSPPGERKVVALPTADGPLVPGPTLRFREANDVLSLDDATKWIDPALRLDETPLTFGLTHTDSNQHVNSLVYPALFEDAALRRLIDLDYDTRSLLVDFIDIAFRKPCFAGQRMFIWLRPFERKGKLGAVGYLGPRECEPERAHCVCALTFRNGELR